MMLKKKEHGMFALQLSRPPLGPVLRDSPFQKGEDYSVVFTWADQERRRWGNYKSQPNVYYDYGTPSERGVVSYSGRLPRWSGSTNTGSHSTLLAESLQ